MNDEAVALRLAQTHGVGTPIFDEETDSDELKEILRDLDLAE